MNAKVVPDTYRALIDKRGLDVYPDEGLKEHLIEKSFPDRVETMAFKLSNVTAGFYGLGLKQVGMVCGWDKVNDVSTALFRELGQMKAQEALDLGIEVPKDSRAPGVVFVTAAFTSSPEYNFEFVTYTPKETVLRIFGACRYYRIASKLNIESHIVWPVLVPFFQGIAERIGARCSVAMTINKLEKDGTCDYLARFVMEE